MTLHSTQAANGQHEPSAGLRARIEALPEELQAAALQLARLGYDATAALRQLHEQGQARAKAAAGLPLTEREAVALAYARANGVRAAHGLPAAEMPAALDLDRRAPALSKAEAAQAAEAARNAHARYGR